MNHNLQDKTSDRNRTIAATQLIQIKYILVGILALATGKWIAA
jgi:hypothetical protein